MFLYIAIAFWIAALVFSASEGQRKLPLLSLLTGIATLFVVNNGGQNAVASTILGALGMISLLNSKLMGLKTR